jgi:hypothetical protein
MKNVWRKYQNLPNNHDDKYASYLGQFRLQMWCGQHEPIDEIGFYDEDADSVVRWAIDEFGHVFLKGYIFRSIH